MAKSQKFEVLDQLQHCTFLEVKKAPVRSTAWLHGLAALATCRYEAYWKILSPMQGITILASVRMCLPALNAAMEIVLCRCGSVPTTMALMLVSSMSFVQSSVACKGGMSTLPLDHH